MILVLFCPWALEQGWAQSRPSVLGFDLNESRWLWPSSLHVSLGACTLPSAGAAQRLLAFWGVPGLLQMS